MDAIWEAGEAPCFSEKERLAIRVGQIDLKAELARRRRWLGRFSKEKHNALSSPRLELLRQLVLAAGLEPRREVLRALCLTAMETGLSEAQVRHVVTSNRPGSSGG